METLGPVVTGEVSTLEIVLDESVVEAMLTDDGDVSTLETLLETLAIDDEPYVINVLEVCVLALSDDAVVET